MTIVFKFRKGIGLGFFFPVGEVRAEGRRVFGE